MTASINVTKCQKCGLSYDAPFASCPVCTDWRKSMTAQPAPRKERAKPPAESEPKLVRKLIYIQKTNTRKLVKRLGKRCSDEFLQALDDLVRKHVVSASKIHNGGRKTLDAACLGLASRK